MSARDIERFGRDCGPGRLLNAHDPPPVTWRQEVIVFLVILAVVGVLGLLNALLG